MPSSEGKGLGGETQERPRWAGDDQMEWLLWLGSMSLTARRVVHDNGLYESVLAEATTLGLLTQATAERPAPGPADRTRPQVRAMRRARWDAAEAPAGCADLGPFDESIYARAAAGP
jgi:hypothetical protein